jgi:hypothetical protein
MNTKQSGAPGTSERHSSPSLTHSAKADSSIQAPAELLPMAVAKPPLQTAAVLLLLLLVVAAASWLQTVDAASGTYYYLVVPS